MTSAVESYVQTHPFLTSCTCALLGNHKQCNIQNVRGNSCMFLQATWPQEFSHCQVAVINSVSLVSECCKHLWRIGRLGTQLSVYPSQRLVLIKVPRLGTTLLAADDSTGLLDTIGRIGRRLFPLYRSTLRLAIMVHEDCKQLRVSEGRLLRLGMQIISS